MLQREIRFRSAVLVAFACIAFASCQSSKPSGESPAPVAGDESLKPNPKIVPIRLALFPASKDTVKADPRKPELKKNKERGVPDVAEWRNESGREVTLKFNDWPFIGAHVPIRIADKDKARYVVNPDAPNGEYGYEILPPGGTALNLGPPADPAVLVGD